MGSAARLALAAAIAILAASALLAYPVLSASSPVIDRVRTLYIVAVSTLPNGTSVGVYAELRVEVRCPGSGHVYIETWPLTEIDTQASARVAAMVAAMVAGIPFSYCDYFASIVSNSSIVGGPSASLAMAVAFAAALMNLPLDRRVVMTGMIMPDGSVGPVGGLYYKLHAAAEVGAKLFLVPYGQINVTIMETVIRRAGPMTIIEQVPKTISLRSVGQKLGVDVRQVATVFQALSYATDGRYRVPTSPSIVSERLSIIRERLKPLIERWISEEVKVINGTLAEFRKAWSEARRNLSGYALVIVEQLVNSLRKHLEIALEQGRELGSRGLLYAAASRYFYALVLAKQMLYVAKIVGNPGSVNATVDRIESEARELLKELELRVGKHPSLYQLSIAMDVAERAFDAIMSAKDAEHQLAPGILLGLQRASYDLGYADARLLTARLWMELLNESLGPSPRVSLSAVWRASQNVIDYARTVGSYVYALASEIGASQPSEVSEANKLLEMAESSRNPVYRLTLAIEGLSYAYVALVKLFALPYTVDTLNRSIEALTTLLIERDALPPDVALYLELAKLASGSTLLEMYSTISIRLASMLSILLESKPAKLPATNTTTPLSSPRTVTVTKTVERTRVVTTTSTSILTHTVTQIVRTLTVLKYGKSYTPQWVATVALAIAVAALILGASSYAKARRWESGYATSG